MKNLNNTFIALGVSLLGLCSCGQTPHDPASEDYDRLFPFGGISGAPESESILPLRPCDPMQSLRDYKDLSNKNSAGQTLYEVSFTAVYYVRDESGELVKDPERLAKARFSIRYIDKDGRICQVFSNQSTNEYPDARPDHVGEPYLLTNGETLVSNFTVRSGYPLYLSVDGVADNGAEVRASIRAVARDGSVIVPKLEVHQFQNREGVDRLSQPYCNYIILP